jgi:protease-4
LNREKLIAGALVLFSAIAAAGSWFTHQPPRAEGTKEVESLFGARDQVAQLDIKGMILDSGGPGGFGGGAATTAEKTLKAIQEIRADGAPVVLLNINSPGGTASGAQAIYDELMRLKRDKKVKIVASMGDVAASGGYYIAAAADTIVANPSTLTGSIGVIMHTQNYQGLMGKLGVQNGAIKSAPHKDIGSPYRPITPEEQKLLQGIIDDTYQQFLEAVSAGRHLPVAQLKPLADGRIFTGRQAQKAKLVDQLGNYQVALDAARKLGGLRADAEVKDYSEGDWRGLLRGLFASESAGIGRLFGQLGPFGALGAGGPAAAPELAKIPLTLYE